MKKTAQIIILMLFSTIFFACNKKQEKPKSINTLTSGYMTIAVDQTVQNVIQQVVDMYESSYPVKIDVINTNEQEAVELIKEDSVRFAITARPFSESELYYFRKKTFQPEAIRIAIDGVALITHPSNKDSLISVKDVQRILTGEVTHWNQIYPHSKLGKIQVVFDHTQSSLVRYANDSICRDKPLSPTLNALNLNEEVVEHVSKVPSALGLIGVNHISNHNDSIVIDFVKKIRVMYVSEQDEATEYNSAQPIQYYLYNGDYPFRREIYILLNDPRGELPKGFARFMSGPRGQRIIKSTGLLPSTMPIQAVKIVD